MNPAVETLIANGFNRSAEDFDPAGEPRPFLYLPPGKGGVTWKAIVGRMWTTLYELTEPQRIGEMESVRTEDREALLRLVKACKRKRP